MTEMLLLDPVQVLQGQDMPLRSVEQRSSEMAGWKHSASGADGWSCGTSPPRRRAPTARALPGGCAFCSSRTVSRPGETLSSLMRSAGAGGFGQIALLPDGDARRERPEHLQGFELKDRDVDVHLWAGFSQGGDGERSPPCRSDRSRCCWTVRRWFHPIHGLDRSGTHPGECGSAPLLIAPSTSTCGAKDCCVKDRKH